MSDRAASGSRERRQGVPGDFDLQPTLRGRLLELRPLRSDDVDELYAVASDPLIWEQHPASDRYQPEVFAGFFREAIESGGAFAAIDRTTGRIIGSSRYFGYDAAAGEVEIGWTFLARVCWGGGYNREMKDLMLRHAFRFVERVIFLVGPGNLRSRREMEKFGGVRVGTAHARGHEASVYENVRSRGPAP
jgi:RimJ/RimL family protein N-acetyltransferase